MRIDEERLGDITILTVHGEIDARTMPDANEVLAELFKTMRVRIVINLKHVEIVTSTMISFLIDAAKRTRNYGGDAVLTNPTRLLKSSLKALDILDFFKIFDDDAAAVAHFRDAALDDTEEKVETEEEPPKKKRWFGRG